MRVLYDGYIYKVQKAGGIGRYFNNIINRLPDSFIPILTTVNSRLNIELPNHDNLKVINYDYFSPYRISAKLEKLYFKLKNHFLEYDIVHPTYYTLLSGNRISAIKKPVIITIHDMIYELFSERIENSELHIAWKKDAIMAADVIVCVSNNTRYDLLKFYPSVVNKVSVIYEGSELCLDDSFGDEQVPDSKYFIYVGGRTFYKNFSLLIQAFSTVIISDNSIKLCIVGPHLTNQEIKLLADYGISEHVEYYGYVTSSHLAKLYRSSIALVYPSWSEGC
ncbi:glycosyltransferase [Dolichospermum sp. ST_sed3]|nr:glycosyltransferase [Dolichospermum sp. ST_sed3]